MNDDASHRDDASDAGRRVFPRPAVHEAKQFGPYELLYEAARGGMGIVYKARDTRNGREAAVKMLFAEGERSAEEVARLQIEAEAAARLDHENIVPVYEVGEHNGRHFFSMEFIDGVNLARRLRGRPMDVYEAAALVRTICEAVDYAHRRGVIHRDLKPSNILLGRDGRPHITDFGLARQVERDDEPGTGGRIFGTPSYMSPEQAAGRIQEIGPAADVYGLGALLYESLTGKPPFTHANPWETIRHVLRREPIAPRILNPLIPFSLETILLKSLDKEPRGRYSSAQELADDLGHFLEGKPVRARRLSAGERMRRWIKRRPLSAIMLVLLVLLLSGLAVVGYREIMEALSHD